MGNVFSTPPPDGKPVLTVHQSLLADLEQRFKERGNVEDSWMMLSLPKDEAEGIELFLAEEDLPEEGTIVEKRARKLVDIDLGPEFETMVFASLEVFDSYPLHVDDQIEAEKRQDDENSVVKVMEEAPRRKNIAIKISQNKSDASSSALHFDPSPNADGCDGAELQKLKAEVASLSAKLNRMHDLETQMAMLQSVFSSIVPGQTLEFANSNASSPQVQIVAQTREIAVAAPEIGASLVSASAPPPPPPPPPTDGDRNDSNVEKKPSWRDRKPEKVEVTSADIERIVRSEINLSGKTPAAQNKATDNFLHSFRKPEHQKLMRKMALDYPFLIRNLPLQPLECVKRMMCWEKHLFRDLEKENELEAQALRKRKMIEIIKLPLEQVEQEVIKIRVTEESRRQKELEAREASSTKGNLLEALNAKFQEHAEESLIAQTEQELANLEVGSLDDVLDDVM